MFARQTRTPREVAVELVAQASDRMSILRRTVAGSLARSAEVSTSPMRNFEKEVAFTFFLGLRADTCPFLGTPWQVHGAVTSQVCAAVEKSLHLLVSKIPARTSWFSNFKCLGGSHGVSRTVAVRGSHEPNVQPPRALRRSTGPLLDHNSPTMVTMPQLEMSARRSTIGAVMGSTRHREMHRSMHGYSAMDMIGKNGREVVTGQMVFAGADIDQSNHMDTDDDPITYISAAAGEGDHFQQGMQPQPTGSLLPRRQTPQNIEEKMFNVSSRSLYCQPRRLDDDW